MTGSWRNGLRQKLEELIDTFVVEGVSNEDACRAITEEVAKLRTAYEHDPDPAEDVEIEEPANDWPSAS
jgi:polyhydroxyalkanoate synthesis regulator phasin